MELSKFLERGFTEGCEGVDITVTAFRTLVFFVLCTLTVSASLLVIPELLTVLLPFNYSRALLFSVSAAIGLVSSGSAFIMYAVYRGLDEAEITREK